MALWRIPHKGAEGESRISDCESLRQKDSESSALRVLRAGAALHIDQICPRDFPRIFYLSQMRGNGEKHMDSFANFVEQIVDTVNTFSGITRF